jgi:DUF971 family protein
MAGEGSWPTELRLNPAKDVLTVSYDDGARFALSAEYLRVESPSAEVKGHSGKRQTVPGKRGLKISRLDPVGNYAVRIVFADGHDSGLYSWSYLRELGEEEDVKWPAYLEELAAQGMSRG